MNKSLLTAHLCKVCLRLHCAVLLPFILLLMGLSSCSKSQHELPEKLLEKETSDEKSAYKLTQEETRPDLLELDKHEQ